MAVASGVDGAMPQAQTTPVRIEADVYSGRPNPNWTLSAAQSETLIRRLRALPTASGGTQRDGLGYRGMIVRFDPAPDGLCASIRVGNGLACCAPHPGAPSGAALAGAAPGTAPGTAAGAAPGATPPGSVCRRDVDREIERWLVASGEQVLEPALLKMLHDELKSSP
jgi:hypothetical protein